MIFKSFFYLICVLLNLLCSIENYDIFDFISKIMRKVRVKELFRGGEIYIPCRNISKEDFFQNKTFLLGQNTKELYLVTQCYLISAAFFSMLQNIPMVYV